MKRKIIFSLAIILLVSWPFGPVFSQSESSAEGKKVKIKIEGASEENQIVSLGKATDRKTGREIEGFAMVHFAKSLASAKGPKSATCYSFLAKGAKWLKPEQWVVNSENRSNLDPNSIMQNINQNISKYEIEAGTEIFGDGHLTQDILTPDTSAPDGLNEVMFGSVDNPGAIAVTIVWGVFGGPVSQRELVEWDQIYDDEDYDWSLYGESNKMDFENIATHELGHSVGLNDLYTSGCSEETLYGYAAYGETKKRDLNTGDINGIRALY